MNNISAVDVLPQQPSFVFELEQDEQEQLVDVLQSVTHQYEIDNFENFYWHCFQQSFRLPARLQKKLFDFRAFENENYLLIKGLPVPENLGATPLSYTQTNGENLKITRTLISMLLSRIGYIYSFAGKKNFNFIDDVFPIEKHQNEQLGTNKDFLQWHVEDGFHDAKADWVALFCLRGDINAETYLFQTKSLRLDADTLHQLQQSDYEILVDPTFNSRLKGNRRVAVLSQHEEPEMIFDPAYMRCLTPKAEAAMNKLTDYINANKEIFILAPGEMLLFDNRRVAHARSSYEPRYDGTDRWLLRALMLESKFKARDCFDSGTLRAR
ncbi:TauD/TfdA family dioxygenase [Pleionea sp. CnH1-48]|uniref:TauD/TfdA family dioxygenase n=1 Tax=Pleionea sp. CnH1-48 TaxID=2954494 RepID=UPI0020969396|nr:TauD/TfdA family dioxygenase [Pleionea sp. CnH1-48]MCO7224324.1 TauD/TfdA family dioxygenase [Pleionea sp. CnH1-48]